MLLLRGMFQYGGDDVQSARMAFLSQRSSTVEVFRESEVVAPFIDSFESGEEMVHSRW